MARGVRRAFAAQMAYDSTKVGTPGRKLAIVDTNLRLLHFARLPSKSGE